jgi:hypothetical protein
MAIVDQPYPIFYFADDSIFFTRGDAKNLPALNEVLQTYSEGSAQRINFEKSSVFFGDHCPEHIKDRIMTCLNVRCEAIQTNYLGTHYYRKN